MQLPASKSVSVRFGAPGFLRLVLLLVLACLGGCSSLPTDVHRPVSHALTTPEETTLGRQLAQQMAKVGAGRDSGFRLVGGTEAAYTSRLALVDAAEKTLDLQYYAILADHSTEQLVIRMRAAAARGVRIRILLDDFNTVGANAQVLQLAFEPNIDLRLFNPLPGSRSSLFGRLLGSIGEVDQIQRRMHNKMFIADNVMGITGGRNLGDAYFGQGTDSNFIDLDVLAAGGIVRRMSASFDAYWNNPLAFPVRSLLTPDQIADLRPRDGSAPPIPAALRTGSTEPASATPAPPPVPAPATTPLDLSPARLTWAPSLLLVDKADKLASEDKGGDDTVVDGLLRLMGRTRHDLLIVSPYFVPGDPMMAVFQRLRDAGVRIRVLTNSLASNDAPLAHVGYTRYRQRLLEMGVDLYEMRAEPGAPSGLMSAGSSAALRVARHGSESTPQRSASATGSGSGSVLASRASLHAKTLVLDDDVLVVGSMNLDLRSQLQNTEIALLIRNRALAQQALAMAAPVLQQNAYHLALDQGRLVWRAPDGSVHQAPGEPDASAGLQFMLKLIGPFAPDEML